MVRNSFQFPNIRPADPNAGLWGAVAGMRCGAVLLTSALLAAAAAVSTLQQLLGAVRQQPGGAEIAR